MQKYLLLLFYFILHTPNHVQNPFNCKPLQVPFKFPTQEDLNNNIRVASHSTLFRVFNHDLSVSVCLVRP